MRKEGFVVLALLLTGCMSGEVKQARQKEMDMAVPVCVTEKQCAAEWNAAVAWVSSHCGMKIQTQTDSLIQTFNSPPYSTETDCSVSKQPVRGGQSAIVIRVGCSNFIGCQPDTFEQVMAFDSYVKQAGAAFSPILIGAAFEEIQSDGSKASISAESAALKVMAILPGSRSEKAGLHVGDVVQAMNGERVRTQQEWTDKMLHLHGGDLLTVGIVRAGVKQVIDIQL